MVIRSVAEPAMARADDLALAMTPAYAADLPKGRARAALVWEGADWPALGLQAAVAVVRPRFAMTALTALMDPGQDYGSGIHPSACVDPSATIGANVTIGPLSVVAKGARIGDNSVIGPLCFIGAQAHIGARGYLREHVSIGARVRIGQGFTAQPGARIGSDGFSYATAQENAVEGAHKTHGEGPEAQAQAWVRIHSLGGVHIGDDVEIGANACVDSGTIRATAIGNGTKLDNLVQIGHNVVIGQNCLLCGQVGIAGSTQIGNNVVMAGQTGVGDHLKIGDNVITGGATKILTHVPSGQMVMGYPAVKMETHTRIYKALRRLPRFMGAMAAWRKADETPPRSG